MRPLLGPAVVLDRQRLDPQAQLGIRLLELSGADSLETMTVPEARGRIRSDAATFAGPKIPLARTEELTVAGSLAARLYVPVEVASPGALLVYFHGGGFVVGDLDTHDNTCRFIARQAGIRVVAVDYRLAPEHPFPAAIDDAVSAFQWVGEHASDLGGDPRRLAVGGDSAGGNLAAGVAQAARGDEGPAFQLLFYPWVDLSSKRDSYRLFGEGFLLTEAELEWYRRHYLGREEDATDPRCSPLLGEHLEGIAPAYIATAGFDPLRDEGEAYATRLREAGVRVALRRHSGLIHAFVNSVGVGRLGKDALLEACGALRLGLAG
jgi:acetyl esterase